MKTSDITELYSKTLFYSAEDSVSFKESDESATVRNATLVYQGAHFDYCTENIWKASPTLYQNNEGGFEFNRRCDGFMICRTGEKKYLIWIEIKTGFSLVFDKAINQLAACYVKMKSYLRNISTYQADDYKEIAIVVSNPENMKSDSIENNNDVIARRASFIEQNETPSDKCRKRYRKSGKIIIKSEDFNLNNLHLVSGILPDNLQVIHCTTTTDTATIDLETILSAI